MNNLDNIANQNEIVKLRYQLLNMTQDKKNTVLRHELLIKIIQRLTEILVKMQVNRQVITLKWIAIQQAIILTEGAR